MSQPTPPSSADGFHPASTNEVLFHAIAALAKPSMPSMAIISTSPVGSREIWSESSGPCEFTLLRNSPKAAITFGFAISPSTSMNPGSPSSLKRSLIRPIPRARSDSLSMKSSTWKSPSRENIIGTAIAVIRMVSAATTGACLAEVVVTPASHDCGTM